ncbi:MAG: DUF938 domain-containing protein [Pacificimonas sp.]
MKSSPAALRNREVIANVLSDVLPDAGRVLMIAEGSGEHAVHLAAKFPALDWYPTDPDPDALASIEGYRCQAGLPNLHSARPLNAANADWPLPSADAITCINMIHISPWAATEGLMRGAARLLGDDGILYLYGPYIRGGVETAPSNLDFDASLRSRNPAWGLRQLEDVTALAAASGLNMTEVRNMPANNLSVVFRRR